MSAAEHSHDTPAGTEGGPDDGAFDWFRVLDIAVWVSVALVVILAADWFFGALARETVARQAQKYLRREAHVSD